MHGANTCSAEKAIVLSYGTLRFMDARGEKTGYVKVAIALASLRRFDGQLICGTPSIRYSLVRLHNLIALLLEKIVSKSFPFGRTAAPIGTK